MTEAVQGASGRRWVAGWRVPWWIRRRIRSLMDPTEPPRYHTAFAGRVLHQRWREHNGARRQERAAWLHGLRECYMRHACVGVTHVTFPSVPVCEAHRSLKSSTLTTVVAGTAKAGTMRSQSRHAGSARARHPHLPQEPASGRSRSGLRSRGRSDCHGSRPVTAAVARLRST